MGKRTKQNHKADSGSVKESGNIEENESADLDIASIVDEISDMEAEARPVFVEEPDSVEIPLQSANDVALPEYRELTDEEMDDYRGLIEAVLFASPEPVSLNMIARKAGIDRTNARILVDTLVDDYAERDGGVLLREIAGGYQFLTSDRYASRMSAIREQKKDKLSRSVMETLSIICYRQPVTLPEIEEIRGVNSRSMVAQLLQRKLVKPQGYRPVPGRPTLYVTTRNFLIHFGLNSLSDLPPLHDVKELPFDDIE